MDRTGSGRIALGAAGLGLALVVGAVAVHGCGPPPAPAVPGGNEAKRSTVPPPPVSMLVLPPVLDHFMDEPCDLWRSGGLLSVPGALEGTDAILSPVVGLSMGDVTQVGGEFGRRIAGPVVREVLRASGARAVVAGEAELGLGSKFVREELGRVAAGGGFVVLCANGVDAEGGRLLDGFTIAVAGKEEEVGTREILIVGVAGESIQEEITARGSDVRLVSASEAAAEAFAAGMRRAADAGVELDTAVLLVHGTEEEAAGILAAVPGFTFAAAAHGGVLPQLNPRSASGVPIYYAGQRLRFVSQVFVDERLPGGVVESPMRLGEALLGGKSPHGPFLRAFETDFAAADLARGGTEPEFRAPHVEGLYVGAEACAACHADAFRRHASSPHGAPPEQLADSPRRSSSSCFGCHATGAAFRGGWWGREDPRADMGAVSCEACHGPGSEHVSSPVPGWGDVDLEDCRRCHMPERSPGFDPAAAWEQVGHGER